MLLNGIPISLTGVTGLVGAFRRRWYAFPLLGNVDARPGNLNLAVGRFGPSTVKAEAVKTGVPRSTDRKVFERTVMSLRRVIDHKGSQVVHS